MAQIQYKHFIKSIKREEFKKQFIYSNSTAYYSTPPNYKILYTNNAQKEYLKRYIQNEPIYRQFDLNCIVNQYLHNPHGINRSLT